MDKQKTYSVEVQNDEQTGDTYMEIPEELLESLGWKENDNLIWHDNGDDTFTLKRVESETRHIEKRVHHAILDEFVHLLKNNEDEIMDILKSVVGRREFCAMRYKEKSEYDRLLIAKRLYNIVASILKL